LKRRTDQYADLYPSGFDYLLTAIAGALTSISAGMSVANPTVGWIFVILTLLGVWISFAVMRTIQGTKLVGWSGFIYTAGVIAAFFSSRSLVELLPDNPFKAQIFVAGLLLWMLVFGSFLIWSDQTLLFQAVPSIAIFGLVGCYDTYRDATWMFFGFLLCFATLLARVHGRTMLRQAKESGYSQTGERMDRSATELERMRSGPWKWVAGPQWALGSAFVVILFSFLGAPIIRESVQGVAGVVRVSAPVTARGSGLVPSNTDPTGMRIGNGPQQLADLPIYRVSLDQPRYLRTAIYQAYSSLSWQAMNAMPINDQTNDVLNRSGDRRSIAAIANPKILQFEIEPLSSRTVALPIPGEITEINPQENTVMRSDGTLTMAGTGKVNLYRGRAVVSDSTVSPKDALREAPVGMEMLVSTAGIRPRVFELANKVAETGETDFERAQLIKEEIERRVRYNLNAAAIPSGKDPVETFLFESKEGYCDLFASAMVLMARSVGISARMVTGYFPISGERDADGRYILKESEKHAWAELFFEGHGWMVFDATEGAAQVPGGERGSANVSALASSGILQIALDVGIALAAIVILFLSFRAVFRGANLPFNRSELDREYIKFTDILTRATGKVRNFDQTPEEYVQACAPFLNGTTEQALAINGKFERMLYSAVSPTRESVKALRGEIAAFRTNLRGVRAR
jgi:hypothetical protein